MILQTLYDPCDSLSWRVNEDLGHAGVQVPTAAKDVVEELLRVDPTARLGA